MPDRDKHLLKQSSQFRLMAQGQAADDTGYSKVVVTKPEMPVWMQFVERLNFVSQTNRTRISASGGAWRLPSTANNRHIEGIEPLTSWLELLGEGATMRHCVGNYNTPVAWSEVFIYRMMSPERLTISLEHRNDAWVVGEVRASCNANPSPGALELVGRWVNL